MTPFYDLIQDDVHPPRSRPRSSPRDPAALAANDAGNVGPGAEEIGRRRSILTAVLRVRFSRGIGGPTPRIGLDKLQKYFGGDWLSSLKSSRWKVHLG